MKKWIAGTVLLSVIIGLAYYFFPEEELPADSKIDRLVVIKSQRIMKAYSNGKVIKTYHVSLWRSSGDKEAEGDKRTPEGGYTSNDRNPNSGYYKNLGVSYPNEQDRKQAR